MLLALASLLFFAAWTLGLVVLGIGGYRLLEIARRRASPRDFPGDELHGPKAYRRLMRAHANCVENLPVFGVVVLVGFVTHSASTPWSEARLDLFAVLATIYVCARVGQSIAHVASGSNNAIRIRFTFFLAQIVAVLSMSFIVALQLARG